jgi:hypothetical protein
MCVEKMYPFVMVGTILRLCGCKFNTIYFDLSFSYQPCLGRRRKSNTDAAVFKTNQDVAPKVNHRLNSNQNLSLNTSRFTMNPSMLTTKFLNENSPATPPHNLRLQLWKLLYAPPLHHMLQGLNLSEKLVGKSPV